MCGAAAGHAMPGMGGMLLIFCGNGVHRPPRRWAANAVWFVGKRHDRLLHDITPGYCIDLSITRYNILGFLRLRLFGVGCMVSMDWLQCIRQSDEGRMT